MNDPHVVTLHYELSFVGDVDYKPPQSPVTYQRTDFDIEVDGTHVRFMPKIHFPDRQSARAACDPLVRAWEVTIALDVGMLGVMLKYQRTEIIDRNPTPGVIEVHAEGIGSVTAFGTATLIRTLNRYPQAPDSSFLLTPDAESLWQRYRMFKEGREPLLSMAYFVLTAIESPAGGRKAAAMALNVDEGVLRKIGELSSTRGDNLSARKLGNDNTPLRSAEGNWLEKAIECLILQVGRSQVGRSQHPVTFGDLPNLSE